MISFLISWPLWAKIGGGVVTIAGPALAYWKYFRHERPQLVAGEVAKPKRAIRAVDLLPYRWEVNVTGDIGTVSVCVWAINYLNEPTTLRAIRAPYFAIEGTQGLDISDPNEITLPARRPHQVLVQRSLIDAEARMIREHAKGAICEAQLRLSARWEAGKKSGTADSGGPYSALGIVRGGRVHPS